MALPDPTTLAAVASLIAATLAGIMAVLGWKSLRRTGNLRLGFVVIAFVFFVFKGLFTAYNVETHAVQHDSIEFVLSVFDLMIVIMLFVPFFLNPKGS